MHGTNHVNWGEYQSRHNVVNEVLDATVNRRGVLTLRVRILRRHLAHEEGSLPDERFRGDLPSKDFEIRLEPVPGQCRELRGVHEYTRGAEVYQAAVEQYVRID